MEEAEIIDLYELEYSDLILLSSSSPPLMKSPEEIQRIESITRNVMRNLGPTGPGLLSITGVPKASHLRRTLLPLARKLSLLNHDYRKRLLKEHNLGSDVSLKNLDRVVSSFAMQLKYEQGEEVNSGYREDDFSENERQRDRHDGEFKELGCVFKELGCLMMEIGVRLARICDGVIGGHELEEGLLESCTAKGRLIHYHSSIDNVIVKESGQRKKTKAANGTGNVKQFGESKVCDGRSSLWQQWHYDYGIFTLLTAPMFLLANHTEIASSDDYHSSIPCAQECSSPSGHTYLQIFDPEKNRVFMVKMSSESYIVQVGEAADVLSKGKLQATLHCVCRPAKLENLSRETFVVFLQPAWNKTFSLSDYPIECLTSGSTQNESSTEKIEGNGSESVKFHQEIHKIIPPLASRLKDGMTFAEFSKETTKQYYGGSGLQSNR